MEFGTPASAGREPTNSELARMFANLQEALLSRIDKISERVTQVESDSLNLEAFSILKDDLFQTLGSCVILDYVTLINYRLPY